MDGNELWEKACALMRKEMNHVTYSTFIEGNLTPVRMEDDVLILRIAMEQMKTMLVNRYQPMIITALTTAAGRRVTCDIRTEAELKQTEKPVEETPGIIQLNPHYTFDTFVVGSANRFAHAAAVAVAENPAEAYNPLFIHGGVGLGKTHLMHAIGHYVQQQYPEKRLLYVTSETFINELISAIQQGRNTQFRNRFRNVDILMVDDIQFIAGKDSTQEEFFHTFNELFEHGKQIILTSDKPPQEIAKLEERLRSRFAWGLIADIQRPDVETRTAILRAKAISEGVTVPDEVLGLIADHVNSNIRELEGSFNKLLAYSQLSSEPITMDLARIALRDILSGEKHRQITAGMIMQTVCEYFSVTIEDLTSATRKREITVPRQIAMYLTRDLTAMSLPQIGTAFGNRDHTTVLHACSVVGKGIQDSDEMAAQVNDLRQMIQNQ
ncbi:MAG: chromosomal replication initiator protein DnaA [Clostridiales bacterium]|nr:chromosomal replication initiator protein DnaA [Clostridiales bacterium]